MTNTNCPIKDRKDDGTDCNDLARPESVEAVCDQIADGTEPELVDEIEDKPTIHQGNRKQSDVLIDIADAAELSHSADDIAYADLKIENHRETWPIESRGFKRWLTHRYFQETDSAPSPDALRQALAVLDARARFEGPRREVFTRVARSEGPLYIDLCNDAWQAIEIDGKGWRVVDGPPVRFLRRQGMLPLPVPARGGAVETLRKYVNIKSDDNFVLLVGFILGALRCAESYPGLSLMGEQGSAKSTLIKIIRALTDPVKPPLRAPPRENRDLYIAASKMHVLAYDNMSDLPDWLSDSLCRLATGGGFGTRCLYTDDDEKLFDGVRPVILGSIGNIITRGDLADRCIALELSVISETARRDDGALWVAFERDRPAIFGALLDAVSHGLHELPHVKLERKPRMADFALWVAACEGTLWPAGTFERAYALNRATRSTNVIEGDLVALMLQEFMRRQDGGKWSGTATELLEHLNRQVDDRQYAHRTWPKAPNALSGRLTRIAPEFRRAGIDIVKGHTGEDRMITIAAVPNKPAGKIVTIVRSSGKSENKGFRADDRSDDVAGNDDDRQNRKYRKTGGSDDPNDPNDRSRSNRKGFRISPE